MTLKENRVLLAPKLKDGVSLHLSAPAAGVRLQDSAMVARHCRLTLDGLSIAVLAANDYGSAKLLDLPDRNLLLLSVEVDCVVTKAGTTNGIVAATDLDMAIGTAAASNATLSSTMVNVIEKVDIDTDALAVDLEIHSSDQSTAAFPLKVVDGASSALYLNLACAITANDSVSVSGTIDIRYIDLGNLIS